MENLIGQRIGQYDIIALMGEGGMASVYRAEQMSDGREVALKVIRNHLNHNDEFTERFKREAHTLTVLSHPHIIKVFDYGQQDRTVYLAMELLTGGNLAALIQNGQLMTHLALRVFDQIASALNHAHEHGIIHRDLKSNNVLLDSAGNAYLTDFGIARLMTDNATLTQTGFAVGTPAYMAPEMWTGADLDARVDIYALGVLLFEMLTGTLPFTGDAVAHIMHKHIYTPAPSVCQQNPRLPTALDWVIAKALAKKPGDRFLTVEEFASAVNAAFAGKDFPERAPSTLMLDMSDVSAASDKSERVDPVSSITGRYRRRLRAIAAFILFVILTGSILLFGMPVLSGGILPTGSALPELAESAVTSTPTFTLTASPTRTHTATVTPSPTPSRTPTYTATATMTPTPTRTFVRRFTRTATKIPAQSTATNQAPGSSPPDGNPGGNPRPTDEPPRSPAPTANVVPPINVVVPTLPVSLP
jgi:serine/threonine-protein kinase